MQSTLVRISEIHVSHTESKVYACIADGCVVFLIFIYIRTLQTFPFWNFCSFFL